MSEMSCSMDRTMGDYSPTHQGEICSIRISPYRGIFSPMDKSFKDALDFALKHTGRSLRSVSLKAGVSYDQMKSLMQGKSNTTNIDDGVKMASAFGVSIEDFFEGNFSNIPERIAVPGHAGAGEEIFLTDDHPKGDGLYHVACPSLLPPRGVVAVEVRGDSMEPLYSEGDLLFYSRATADGVPTEAIGKKVIAETEDGRVWVKQLKIGSEPGRFHLLSLNPAGRNMLDQQVKWAAPVRLHLPQEFVRRIG